MSNEYTSSGAVVSKTMNITGGDIWLDTVVVVSGSSKGYLNVLSGGIASGTTVSASYVSGSGARVRIASGGLVSNMAVSSGGSMLAAGGSAVSLDIKRGGSATVSSNGAVASSIISGLLTVVQGGSSVENTITGGTATISNGGIGSANTLKTGSMLILSGGVDSASIISGGTYAVSSGGVAAATEIKRGSQTVFSGGVASGVIVSSGTQVLSGGVASATDILSGGTQTIRSGAASAATVGGLQLLSGGSAVNTVIASGGSQYIYNGATAENTTLLSGGRLLVTSGGVLSGEKNISDIGGAARFDDGAIISGKFFTKGEVIIGGDITFSDADSGIYLWVDSNNTNSTGGVAMLHNFNTLGDDAGNCFISVPGNIADNTYTLADGAEGFTGSIGIYNDDWTSRTFYVSVGETVSANYIDYTLANDNGTLSVTIVNHTIYNKKVNDWSFPDDKTAVLALPELAYAGRFKLNDFIGATSFTGSAVIKDENGKVVASFKVSGGSVAANDFLLDAGKYTLVCTSERANAIKTESKAHIESIELFYRANRYNDDQFNILSDDITRVAVTPGDDGLVKAVISDADNDDEFVGYTDLVDWRQLNIAQDGVYSIDLTKDAATGSALKVTLYSVNGTALKSVGSVTVKDAAEAALLIKDKQLAAGTYYVKFESTSGSKGYSSIYGATITGKVYSGSPAEDTAALTTTLSLDESSDGRVNFASPELFYSWTLGADGIYTLSIDPDVAASVGNNALTVTVYSMADGKTSLTKVLSFSTKNGSDDAALFPSKATFFKQGEYFISVKSANTGKGADVVFTVSSNAEKVYDVPTGNAENFRNAKEVQLNASIGSDIYAGFGAPVEFLALDISKKAPYGGVFDLSVANTGNGKVTVTVWMQLGNKLKKVKSVTVGAGKDVSLADVTFDPDENYFIQIDGSAAAKANQYANVSITAASKEIFKAENTPELESGAVVFSSAETGNIRNYATGGDEPVSWFKLDHKNAVSFTVSNTGTGSATFGIYQLAADGNSVKKIKSVTVGAGKTVSFGSSLAGDGVFFCQIDSTAAAKKGEYATITVTTTAVPQGREAVEKVFASDDSIWQLAPEYGYSVSHSGSTALTAGKETLGADDSIDFRKVTLDHAGFYNFTLTSNSNERNANLTVTVYKWNAAGSALVKVGSAKLAAAGGIKASLKNDLFLSSGEYYVSVECADTAKGGYGSYELSCNAAEVFDHADISAADDDVCGAQNIDTEKECFVGYGDAEDFFVWNVEHDGYYNYTLSSTGQNAKLTATLYTWNAAGTALVKLGTVNLSAAGDAAALKNDILLDKGEYFIGVSCANAAKGGYGYYSLETVDALVFDHAGNDNSDDSAATAKKAVVSSGNTVLVGTDAGFVGYGDKYDFINLSAEQSGEYTFDIATSGTLKFTLYRYDLASGKMVAVIKTTTLKADGTLAPVHLEAGVEYYAAVEAKDAKGETVYSIAASGKTAVYIEAAYDKDSSTEIGALTKGDSALVNFNVSSADAGWEYSFASSENGSLELYMYNESKGVLSQVKTTPGKDIQLAAGSYYIQLEAAKTLADTTALAFDAESRTFSWE